MHVNRYLMQYDFTGNMQSRFKSLSYILMATLYPTVSVIRQHQRGRPRIDFTFLDTILTHPIHIFLLLPHIVIPSHVEPKQAKLKSIFTDFYISFSLFFCSCFSGRLNNRFKSFILVLAVNQTIDLSRSSSSSLFQFKHQTTPNTFKSSQVKPSQAKQNQAIPLQVQAPFYCRQSIMPDAKTIRAYKASLLKYLPFLDCVHHPQHRHYTGLSHYVLPI
jgi:hypothetical protein